GNARPPRPPGRRPGPRRRWRGEGVRKTPSCRRYRSRPAGGGPRVRTARGPWLQAACRVRRAERPRRHTEPPALSFTVRVKLSALLPSPLYAGERGEHPSPPRTGARGESDSNNRILYQEPAPG